MESTQKIDRKTQITTLAEELFHDKGFLATSMRDLADALEIEPASLYSHIKSKDDLLWEIADRCAGEFFNSIEPIAESKLNTRKKLIDMIVAHVEVICRNLKASAVFFNEWRHLEDPRRDEYAQRRDNYEGIFRAVVKEGIKENLFMHYDEGFTTRAILSALNWTHTWYKPDGELRPHEVGEHLAKILMDGIVRKI